MADSSTERGRTVNRLFLVLTVALLVSVPALGCASDDGGGTATQAAPSTSAGSDTGASTLGAGIESVQGQLCPGLSGLEADLTEVSTSGTDAGQDVLAGIGSFASALETAAATLSAAGATDVATAATDLAASLESLSTSGGEDARALAGDAVEQTQQLTETLQC